MHLADQLKHAFDEIILLGDWSSLSEGRAWHAHSSATVIVSELGRFQDALAIAGAHKEPGHRVDIAVLTDVEVHSDNGLGGLWDATVLSLLRSLIGSGSAA
jgi:hypothetical protein